MELSFNFNHPPTAEEHATAAAAPPAKNSSPPPPLLALIPSIEKNETTPVTTTLSLGSLNPLFMLNSSSSPEEKSNEDNSKTISLISESSSATQSVVTQEHAQVAAKKIDQELCTAGSRRGCFKLFGVVLDYPEYSDKVAAVKKRKMEGLDLSLGQEDSSKFLQPSKKRAVVVRDMIKMRKVLTESDVNESSRFLLGNKVFMIEQILPRLNLSLETFRNSNHGEEIKVYDMDMQIERTLVLKRWKTNSYVLNGGWTKYFVIGRNLKKGDEIELAWDQISTRLNFSVVKRAGSS